MSDRRFTWDMPEFDHRNMLDTLCGIGGVPVIDGSIPNGTLEIRQDLTPGAAGFFAEYVVVARTQIPIPAGTISGTVTVRSDGSSRVVFAVGNERTRIEPVEGYHTLICGESELRLNDDKFIPIHMNKVIYESINPPWKESTSD